MIRAYLDACVAIYYVERHPVFFPRIRNRLIPPNSAGPVIALSELTRLECRVHPTRNNDSEMLARFDEFFALPELDWVTLDRAVFDRATDLRAGFGLKTPDALHLAAAITSGCMEFWTNDGRLFKAATGRIQIITFDSSA